MRKIGFGALVLLALALCLFPIIWQLITSLKTEANLGNVLPLLPSKLYFGNYASIFTETEFARNIVNSVIVALASTLLSLTIGSCAAFALAKLAIKSKNLILLFVLASSMFPQIATASPLYIMIRALGFRDTLISLVFVYTTFSLPLSIWVLHGFFRHIPDEIYQASRIDGCSVAQSFRKVIIPLAAPGIATTAILVFLFSWNEFLFALTFTATSRSRTVPVGIALFEGIHEIPWGEIAAASIVAVSPVLVLVLFFQKQIIAGLTAGGVKG